MSDATHESPDLWRQSMRREMRGLAHEMQNLTASMQATQADIRDMKARLEDVIRLQTTKGDLDVVHFELGRIVDRLDALEAAD